MNQSRTVRDLRRLWKPHKERLNGQNAEHPTNVRFHRACSWLQRTEGLSVAGDQDLVLLNQWIAFNALYGQWNQGKREPLSDVECWQEFLKRMLSLDESLHIQNILTDNKRLVMSILDDEYVSRYFWQEPSNKRANQSKKAKYDARTWYIQGNWNLVIERLVERIYFLRCQLVHGASTYNSSLNRTAIRRCSQMLDHLLRSFLLVWIDHGADEDWGIMCYPPLRSR